MPHSTRLILVAALWAIAASAPGAQSAPPATIGPTVMMFYGPPLAKAVFVTGADTAVFGNLHARSPIAAKDLEGRKYISAALFWGPASDPAVNGVKNLADLRPEMAWQHGRLYLATPAQPAAFVTTLFSKRDQSVPAAGNAGVYTGGGTLSQPALALLKRLGIPTG